MTTPKTTVTAANPGGDRKQASMNPEALKRLRTRAGLTQSQVAGRAGIDATHYWRIESGRRDVYSTTLRGIAEALARSLPMTVAEVLDELTRPG